MKVFRLFAVIGACVLVNLTQAMEVEAGAVASTNRHNRKAVAHLNVAAVHSNAANNSAARVTAVRVVRVQTVVQARPVYALRQLYTGPYLMLRSYRSSGSCPSGCCDGNCVGAGCKCGCR